MKNKLHNALSLFVVSLILCANSSNAQIDSSLAAQLQQILNVRVQNFGNHGVSACVIMPDGAVWKGVAGVGAGNAAITDTTVFHGASITKANIAVLTLLLAQDGLLNLDSSWHKYVTLNVNFDTTITIRQLLSHTSGIADYLEVQGTGNYVTNDFTHAFTPVEILENIVSGVPDFAPGTNFNYSTSNYVLAALIAQTVAGNPVQQELHTRIWGPLGMTHTYFGGFENYTEPRSGVWWDFGSGTQDYSSNPETSMLTYGFVGANIVSTPEDLAHFARALFTGNILTQASMNEMESFSPNSYSSWCAGYGLGIHHAYSFPNDSLLGHDGYYTNLSDMFHSFDYGFTLVTMTNTPTQWFGIFDQMYNKLKNYISNGITENTIPSSFALSPNPASTHIYLKLKHETKNAELTITDITGKIIYKTISKGIQNLDIDVSGITEGIYLVTVKTPGLVQTQKLIIEK